VARNDLQQTEARIAGEREDTARLVMALTAELEEIIESMSLSNNDDEHDPDGATNGYERAKATSMLRHARARLVELEQAEARLRDGAYGRCEACGAEIGAERLEALPTTRRCIACAAVG
jgi:DnaK suppressor protein